MYLGVQRYGEGNLEFENLGFGTFINDLNAIVHVSRTNTKINAMVRVSRTNTKILNAPPS